MILGDNLTVGLDYVFFVYGLAFIVLALVSRMPARGPRLPSWPWLTAFAVTHGVNE